MYKNLIVLLIGFNTFFPSIVESQCTVVEYPDRNEVVCTDPDAAYKSDSQKERERLERIKEDRYYESVRQNKKDLDAIRDKCKALEQRVLEQQFIASANAVLSQYKAVCGGREYNTVAEKEELCKKLEKRMNNVQFVKSLETNTAIYRAMCQ